MSNLGTLSFDVDLDLSKLKSKIDQQNEAVKQALEGLQVKVATKSVGELAQQIQSELNNHQFAIKLDEAKLSGLKSDIVSIAEKSKEIADNFARMGQGGGGTQQAVNIDLSKFNGISEIIEKIEGEMKRLYNVFADTTDGSGKQVAGLITNLSLLKDALEQLGTAAKNFTPTQQLNEAATAAQNVATATQNAAKASEQASNKSADATSRDNIEKQQQIKLLNEIYLLTTKLSNMSGVNPDRVKALSLSFQDLASRLSSIPPTTPLNEIRAELSALKSDFNILKEEEKAINSVLAAEQRAGASRVKAREQQEKQYEQVWQKGLTEREKAVEKAAIAEQKAIEKTLQANEKAAQARVKAREKEEQAYDKAFNKAWAEREKAEAKAVAEAARQSALAARDAAKENQKWADSINKAKIEATKLAVQLSELQKLEKTLSEKGIDTTRLKESIDQIRQNLQTLYGMAGGAKMGGTSQDFIKSAQFITPLITANTTAKQLNAQSTNHLSEAEQRLAASIKSSSDSMRGQSQILSDLKTMAMQYLSVWGAQSFIHNIIQTGGLLEQQRMSIGAILGDLSQANHLFGQIQQLALKSPFGVVQLDTMSKQLTAYNFKYSELYDWTKRLADISAATGTEVSRLSLALGHVRSEGALSGYTLRQFAMGNVPLLQTLAQQLGKTTSEIRKMTREKAITYDDVEKALRTLTDEGGIFFNAQEVMSNALNAKFKNMYDAFDIMFGKMAESGVGDVLKKVAETMTVLAKNWQQTGAVILSVAGYLGVYKLAMMASNKVMIQSNLQAGHFTAAQLEMQAASGRLTKQMLLQAVATGKLSVADAEAAGNTYLLSRAQLQHVANTGKVTAAYNMATIATSKYTVKQLRLLATFRAGSWTSWTTWLNGLKVGWMGVSAAAKVAGTAIKGFFAAARPMLAITTAVEAVTSLIQKSSEAKERVKDMLQTANEGLRNLEEESKNFQVGGSVGLDTNKLKEDIKSMEEIVKSYSPQSGNTLTEAFRVDPKTGVYVHSLAEQYDILATAINEAKDAYKYLGQITNVFEDSNNDTDGWLDESFRDNTEDYIDALKERNKAEIDFIGKNRTGIIKALEETRAAFDEYDSTVKMGVDIFEKSGGKSGFSESDLRAQVELLRANSEWFEYFDQKIREAGDDAFASWSNFNTEISKTSEAYGVIDADMQTFTKNSKERLEAVFGATVDNWTYAQKLAVQKGIEIFMTGINGYSDMAEKKRIELEEKLLAPFNIKVDIDAREANKALTEMQAYLEGLVGHNWVVTLKLQTVGSFEQLYDQLDKDVKDGMATMKKLGTEFTAKRRKELQKMAIDTKTLTGSEKEYAEAYQKTEKAKETAAKKNWKLSSLEKQNAKDAAAARKEESAAQKANKKAIEEQKTRLEEVKKFYAEYKKYRDVFGDEKGQSIVEDMFGMTPGQGDKIINEYETVLDEIQKKLEKLGDKKGVLAIKQLKAEINLDKAKKDIDKAISDIQEYISKKSEKFNLYKALLEKTGSKDFAKLAFEDGKIWDDLSKELAEKLKEAISSAGAEIDINTLWDKTDAEAQEMLKGVNGAYDLWKKIVDIIRGNYTEALNKGSDAISNILTAEQKLLKIEQELADLREKYTNSNSDAERAALQAQIESKQKEIEQAKRDAFKESADYLNFYNAILSLTIPEAEKIGKAIKQNLNDELRSGKLSARQYLTEIKKINEQMEKLRNQHSDLSSFLNGGLQGLFQNRQERGESTWERGITDFQKSEKEFGTSVNSFLNAFSKGDNAGMATARAQADSAQSAMEGAKAMQEGGAAMSAGANSAMQTIAIIDMIVHGINDLVQGIKETFDDIRETSEALGNDTDTEGWNNWNTFWSGFSSASNSATKGWDSLKNGNAGGVISGVVGSWTGWIKAFARGHDANQQRLIKLSEQNVKAIERLQGSIERNLERAIGGVYGYVQSEKERENLLNALEKRETVNENQYYEREQRAGRNVTKPERKNTGIFDDGEVYNVNFYDEDTLKAIRKALESTSYYDTSLALLYEQRDEIRHQLEAEQYKKDSDDEAIIEYQQQIEELNDKIKYYALDMAKALYDIDISDWASNLTDAIVEAWENGEDAVEAYNKKVKEMMKDLSKNIIVKKILEKTLADFRIDELIQNLMTSSSGVLDENAVVALGDALMGAGQSAATATTALLDYLEAAGYIEKSAETTKTAFEDLRSTFLETLTDIESNAEDFKKNLEQIMIKDVIEKQILDVPFTINGMTFENFDAYLKNWNERYASAIKAGNQALIDALIDELVQAREITIKAAEELRERLKSVEEDTTFSDMSDSWVTNLMDMSKTAEDWAEDVGKTMAEKIIKEMIVPSLIQPYLNALQQAWNNALPQYTTTDENGNKSYNWEGLLGDSAVRGAIKAITAAYPAASEAVKTVLEKLDIDISNYKYSGFSNLADSIIDSLKSADGSLESWAEDQGKKMSEQMAQAYIDQNYGEELTKLNEEWQQALEEGDAEAIATVEAKLNDLYKRMANDQDLMNLIDDFKELDTTVTGLSDSFVSSLMDMSQSARDWGQDLAKTIAEAVIKMTVVPTLIQPLLQSVQDVFNSAVEAASSIDANGKKTISWEAIINNQGLMSAINAVVEQYPQIKDIIEQIMSAFDVDLYENPFADMVDTFTSSLMDMQATAESFAQDIARTLTEQMIKKVLTDGYKTQLDELGEQWREALENGDVAAIERIKQQLVELRAEMGDAVQPLLDAISDIEKQADTTFSSMTDSWVSALMDMESTAEDFAQQVGKTMAQKIITELIAPIYIQPILDAMQKAYNAAIAVNGATVTSVMTAMLPYIDQIKSVYGELQPIIENIMGTFGIYKDEVQEAAEEVEYALQDLKSNFVSSLMDMENSAEDFSKEISKILAQSFIEKFVLGDKFDAQMKYWQEQYESIIGSGMSEDERKKQLKALRDAIAAAKEGYVNNAMAIMDLLGLTTEDKQEATTNMADKITYDQADQLLGINLAQELTLEQILAFLKGKDMDFTPIYDSLVSNTASQDEHSRIITSTLQGNQLDYNPVLDSIVSQTTAQDEHSRLIASTLQTILDVRSRGNDNILTQVAISNNHLYAISEYTKKMRDEVVMHLGSMDDKLTNLKRL